MTAGLKNLAPEAFVLPAISDLPLFLAVVGRAAVFISGDTGPLHFASGLGVPVIALFGPSPASRWSPVGKRHRILTGGTCGCDSHSSVCYGNSHCIAAITPETVVSTLQSLQLVPPTSSI
jgi:ADP-heptose:LPS heptosyltransferase